MKKIIMLLAGCLFSAHALTQNYAIVDTTVHTMSERGTVENATVIISNGKIQKVLDERPALAGYEIIDGKGKVVTPGIIGAYTSLGLVEVSLSAGTVDSTSEVSPISTLGAAMDVAYAINPDSTLMAISRIDGVTSAASSMARTKQLFNGQGALISLGQTDAPVIKRQAFISTSVSNSGADQNGQSRAVLWRTLEAALDEAEYAQGISLTPQTEWHGIASMADVQALAGVVNGNVPLLIHANRASDIRQVIALKQRRQNLKLVLLSAAEGWRVADELAAAEIPVILNPESNLPYAFDELGATLENAARLHKAGVKVAIGMNTHNIRLVKQHAGNAVANGLPWEAGLAAITRNVAEIYGVDDQIGSIEPGMQADIVMWSGDPLQVTEAAEQVFIGGEKIDMTSRQTKLRDRYLDLNQSRPLRYVRP